MLTRKPLPAVLLGLTGVYLPAWLICWALWLWARWLPASTAGGVFAFSLPLGIAWLAWGRTGAKDRPILMSAMSTVIYTLWWQLALFVTDQLVWDETCLALFRCGLGGLFLIGLAWVIWGLERASQFFERRRHRVDPAFLEDHAIKPLVADQETTARIWNPLDPAAWYYGRRSRKLNQSLTALMTYAVLFFALVLLFSQTQGCQEIYELPAGGGQQKQLAQKVKVQKIIRKKFVVNPFSGIKFEVPPIDDVKLQLTEVTKHAYTVGYGEGQGAGFAGGTARGKVRLIRLQYSGGDWDLNFGIGADQNMLIQYGVRTSQKVAEQTEFRTIPELKGFPKGKSPPLVFMTGQKNIGLSNAEMKILAEYINDKHGMIFASNGGSAHWGRQFRAMMQQVCPDVRPVTVPLDDPIHSIPYQIPFLPYVAPHDGKEAIGWYKDGRWVCYYHPGDISDAWCDDHAGVRAEVWEACYMLGTNVLFYAHAENAKWMASQQSGK